MSATPRRAASLLGVAALGVAAMTGAGWAAGSTALASAASTARASVPRPSFARLSPSQVKARSSGKRERMVVVFDDQLTSLPANRAHRHAREATAASMQAPLVAQLKQVGATHITALSLLNAVAATMPAAEAQALSHTRGVKERRPRRNRHHRGRRQVQHEDGGRLPGAQVGHPGKGGRRAAIVQYKSQQTAGGARSPHQHPRNSRAKIATGRGVIIGNVDADSLAGNVNMIRPNGQHVIIDAPNPNENVFSDEFNGDVSTMAAQGTVTYTYASQLPFANLPANCSFRIVGDAPGASILTTGQFTDSNNRGQIVAPESQVIAGLQQAVNEGVNVVSESYGFGAVPGANADLLIPANVAMVAAGVVVVESSGDSGSDGTVEEPAANPAIIDAGGTNDLRLLAQADGYTHGWEDNSMTTLSSGGTTPQNDVVDLVAPGYLALAVAGINQQPAPALPTEAFGGTSQSAPFVSGAAADVIQAYRDTHGGATPTPAQVKQILTGTATDIGAPADQQGAGLLNIDAAVKAAREMPGTSLAQSSTPELVDNPSQLGVQGAGGSTATRRSSCTTRPPTPKRSPAPTGRLAARRPSAARSPRTSAPRRPRSPPRGRPRRHRSTSPCRAASACSMPTCAGRTRPTTMPTS